MEMADFTAKILWTTITAGVLTLILGMVWSDASIFEKGAARIRFFGMATVSGGVVTVALLLLTIWTWR